MASTLQAEACFPLITVTLSRAFATSDLLAVAVLTARVPGRPAQPIPTLMPILNIRFYVYFGPLTVPHDVNVMTSFFPYSFEESPRRHKKAQDVKSRRGARFPGDSIPLFLECYCRQEPDQRRTPFRPLTPCIYFMMTSKSTLMLAFVSSE